MQTSLKRLGFQFSTRQDMSAKFHRGGGANPFSAIRLYVRYMKCPNTPGPSSIILSIYNKMGIILHCNERANFFRK